MQFSTLSRRRASLKEGCVHATMAKQLLPSWPKRTAVESLRGTIPVSITGEWTSRRPWILIQIV